MVKATNITFYFHKQSKEVLQLIEDRPQHLKLLSGEYETDSTDDQCPDWLAYSFHDWPDLCCVVSRTR